MVPSPTKVAIRAGRLPAGGQVGERAAWCAAQWVDGSAGCRFGFGSSVQHVSMWAGRGSGGNSNSENTGSGSGSGSKGSRSSNQTSSGRRAQARTCIGSARRHAAVKAVDRKVAAAAVHTRQGMHLRSGRWLQRGFTRWQPQGGGGSDAADIVTAAAQ